MTESNAQPTTPSRTRPELRIVETRVMRGPNYWAREPVIRMVVDLGVLEDFPSNLVPGFTDRLVAAMPSLEEHACSRSEERRVGKECTSWCRSRWSPYH